MMLEGMKVVELATHVAAPAACAMLAEWGADVIKVEPPGGDRGRLSVANLTKGATHGDVDLHNRGKRAVAIDIAAPEGREAMLRIVDWADVMVTNMLPQRLERYKLDWPDVNSRNPRLVYLSLTGYGRSGAERERPGNDHTAFWARSGLAAMMAPEGSPPFPLRMAMGDRVTGISAAAGVLAGYIEALRTGQGRLVESSLLRTAIYTAGTDIALQLMNGRTGTTKPRSDNLNPLHGFYRASDGWMAVSWGGDVAPIARALEAPELAEDPAFATARARREHRAAVVARLDAIIGQRTRAAWGERLDAERLIWAPVQTAAEVVADPQAGAALAWTDVPAPGDQGTYRAPAMPISFHDGEGGVLERAATRAPRVGEHTDDVLQGLGYGPNEIAEMRDCGILA